MGKHSNFFSKIFRFLDKFSFSNDLTIFMCIQNKKQNKINMISFGDRVMIM